ncbi:hypothetical protein [Ruminococcus sp.]|uniref:hypothetical protein n=1 Tax=Ruminococcus sp. TaxID=41978 RepID=UPI001B4BFA55|nr:hypothetical protein [Ruminococcus sp.]MBP5432685.1 hypothetical protein [Ruminococcus sp.]
MNSFQTEFMNAIKNIREKCVTVALCEKHTSKADELNSVTYELIFSIMELIDGYSEFGIGRLDIINTDTGESLKKDPFIELHDAVAGYITD